MKYVTKPVLVRRKRNVTGSLSFGRQIGFRFTIFNTTEDTLFIKNFASNTSNSQINQLINVHVVTARVYLINNT